MTGNAHARAGRCPSPDEVRAELARVIGDAAFKHAERAKDFLRFVVEETLAGRSDRLKGYTIAVEVFGRPPDFDAQSDPLVRVEAGRLRHRLMEYYFLAGRDNPVRIELPRGSYVPRFSSRTPSRSAKSTARRWTLGAIGIALAASAVVWLSPAAGVRTPSAPSGGPEAGASDSQARAGEKPRLLVVPFANLSDSGELAYFAYGMTEEVALSLGDFDLLVIASGPTSPRPPGAIDLRTLRRTFAADYVLTGDVKSGRDDVRVSVRLVDARSGARLWAAAFDERLDVGSLIAIQEGIAQQVATTIAVPYGPIFEHEVARIRRKSPEQLGTYDCILRFYYYTAVMDAATHRAAGECFERAVVKEPQFADAWGGLALVYLAENAFGYTPRPGDPVERAREAARTALDIDGRSRLGNQAMMSVDFVSQDFGALKTAAERTIALNPRDASTLGVAGTFLAICGEWERGLALVDRALLTLPHPPPWYYFPRVLRDLKHRNFESALEWSRKMDAPNWFLAPALVAASAALAGHDDIAQRAAFRVLELYPTFPQMAQRELAKWNFDEDLMQTTLKGLRAAGLTAD